MANDPLYINANAGAPAYSANELRQAMALSLMYGGRNMGARPGVRPGGNQLNVSIVGSAITVQPGLMCVDPGLSTPQGPYWVAISPAENHTLTAASVTNPRKDIIIGRVYDHDEDASGNRFARTEYIAGVAAPVPAEPAVPTGAFRIATIDVPISGGGSAVVTNNMPFTVASGGVVPVRTQAERDALTSFAWDGLACWRQDRDWIEVYNGSVWHVRSQATVANTGDLSAITNPFSGQLASNTGDAQTYRYNGTAWKPLPGLIFETTLGVAAANVSIPTIPSTFGTLRLHVVARSSAAVVSANLHVQFNGDTGATQYDYQEDYGQQAASGAVEVLAQNAIPMREMSGASAALANHPGSFVVDIPKYAGTTFIKMINGNSSWSQGTLTGQMITRNFSGRWRSTAAISSMLLFPSTGNFLAGTYVALEGLP